MAVVIYEQSVSHSFITTAMCATENMDIEIFENLKMARF